MGYGASVELFPEELRNLSIPEWRILLIFAYNGHSTMYGIKKDYGFKYSSVHRATQNLERLKWIKLVETRSSEKGGSKKVYGLTLVGLLHLLYRIPRWLRPSNVYTGKEKRILPKEAKIDVSKLSTRQDISFHLLYCFQYDQVAEKNKGLLPLIFGKWDHFKNAHVEIDVFSSMVEVAHVTLADYYHPAPPRRVGSLPKLFAYKVYYNLLKESMFEHNPRRRKGYDSFDYHQFIQQKTIAVFQNDRELTVLFKKICSKIEKEIASLSKSIKKIKTAVLSQN